MPAGYLIPGRAVGVPKKHGVSERWECQSHRRSLLQLFPRNYQARKGCCCSVDSYPWGFPCQLGGGLPLPWRAKRWEVREPKEGSSFVP